MKFRSLFNLKSNSRRKISESSILERTIDVRLKSLYYNNKIITVPNDFSNKNTFKVKLVFYRLKLNDKKYMLQNINMLGNSPWHHFASDFNGWYFACIDNTQRFFSMHIEFKDELDYLISSIKELYENTGYVDTGYSSSCNYCNELLGIALSSNSNDCYWDT